MKFNFESNQNMPMDRLAWARKPDSSRHNWANGELIFAYLFTTEECEVISLDSRAGLEFDLVFCNFGRDLQLCIPITDEEWSFGKLWSFRALII